MTRVRAEKLRQRLEVRRLKKALKRLSKKARRARVVRHESRSVQEEKIDELQACPESEGTNIGPSVGSADTGGSVEIKEEGVDGVDIFENPENARGSSVGSAAPVGNLEIKQEALPEQRARRT